MSLECCGFSNTLFRISSLLYYPGWEKNNPACLGAGLGLIFPEMPQNHRGPFLRTPGSPYLTRSAAGLCRGSYAHGITSVQCGPLISHDFYIFLYFIPLGRRMGEEGQPLFPSCPQSFSFPVFSQLITSLKSSPKLLCSQTFLTLYVPESNP